jgi:signal peptidase I
MSESKKAENKKELYSWIRTILFGLAFGILLHIFILQVVVVNQTSMYPTLKDGDRLLLFRPVYAFGAPARGDIAVIKIDEEKDYVKRVIGLPNETIEVAGNVAYINGEPLSEPYLVDGIQYADFPETVIPDGCYFVMGDNRPGSLDSRFTSVGFIEQERFVGKVALRFWPFKWLS